MHKRIYLGFMIIGTILPWIFFWQFFSTEGLNLPLFITSFLTNPAASGGTMDLMMSIIVFWVWSFMDARKHGIKYWWLTVLAVFAVGLSLALPLYLYLREDAMR